MTEEKQEKKMRYLSSDIIPLYHDIRLNTNLEEKTFSGQVAYQLKVVNATNVIGLHSSLLEIGEVYVTSGNKVKDSKVETVLKPTGFALEKETEFLDITFKDNFKKGDTLWLYIKYSGKLQNNMKGYYYSVQKDEKTGEESPIACTQHEPCDCRKSFPSFDEPAVKSVFKIRLVADVDQYVALSNMPEEKRSVFDKDANLTEIEFKDTVKMSTYLLAWVIGKFEYIEGIGDRGIVHRVYAPIGKKEQGRYALGVSIKSLNFYMKYFDLAYPLPKLDSIAIPDFSAGAMENYGLVTYRTQYLLHEEGKTSFALKQWIALVVAHENSHQFFGNLVTMKWWTDLWLNEGFASWIEYYAVDLQFPEWNIWTLFAAREFSRGLKLDALDSSHPIRVPIKHTDTINEIFDAISYHKGASVIRMLENFLGTEVFKQGLRLYIKKYAYSNAEADNLWDCLSEASKLPVKKLMSSWTTQIGYPFLTVEEANGKLKITQEKFSVSGTKADTLWYVPLVIKYGKGKEQRVLMEGKEIEIDIAEKDFKYVKFNSDYVGFYRIKYSASLLKKLTASIYDGEKYVAKENQITQNDVMQIQSDAFALLQAGKLRVEELFLVLDALPQEECADVWTDIVGNYVDVYALFQSDEKMAANFEKYGCKLFGAIYEKLGFEPKETDNDFQKKLRGLIIRTLAALGDKTVIKKGYELYESKKEIESNIKSAVYTCVVKHSEEGYDKILAATKITENHEEKDNLLRALTSAPTAKTIKTTIQVAMDEKIVRNQDCVMVLGGLIRNRLGKDTMFEYVLENWDTILSKVGTSFAPVRLVSSFGTVANEEKAARLEKAGKGSCCEMAFKQVVETIRNNIKFTKLYGDDFKKFFGSYKF